MVKGRKLTISKSERYLGSYSYGDNYGGNGADVAEFAEDDVWSVVESASDATGSGNSSGAWSPLAAAVGHDCSGSIAIQRQVPSGNGHHVGGLSVAFEGSGVMTSSRIVHQLRGNDNVPSPRGDRQLASSAPVNVPDWSKIYRVDSVESLHDSDDGLEDRDGPMIPPHEYLAREYARSRKVAAPSVFEGVGRTLKGRDMWRMRDAVWSQTGFDG